MGISGTTKDRFGKSLGDSVEVKLVIATYFPGTSFGLENLDLAKLPAGVRGVIAKLRNLHPRDPYWVGTYEDEGGRYAAQFEVDSAPDVRVVNFTLWGQDTAASLELFSMMDKAKGWTTEFPD